MTDNQIRTNFCAQCKERADRIEALKAENERLRGATRGLIAVIVYAGLTEDLAVQIFPPSEFAKHVRRTITEARAALEPKP